jgi:xanthine/uracil/vitamin C permease (AzgA family)
MCGGCVCSHAETHGCHGTITFLAMGVIVVVLVYILSTNLMSGSKKQGFFAFIL